MTVTVRPTRENHQPCSALWRFELGQAFATNHCSNFMFASLTTADHRRTSSLMRAVNSSAVLPIGVAAKAFIRALKSSVAVICRQESSISRELRASIGTRERPTFRAASCALFRTEE